MRLQIDDDTRETLRPEIMECFRRMGKSFTRCEQCGIETDKLEIHHTKYEGATVYDLQLLCRSCNLSGRNLYLD